MTARMTSCLLAGEEVSMLLCLEFLLPGLFPENMDVLFLGNCNEFLGGPGTGFFGRRDLPRLLQRDVAALQRGRQFGRLRQDLAGCDDCLGLSLRSTGDAGNFRRVVHFS